MTWNDLATSKYVLLTTYKKDGTAVGTPVWVAPDGDRIVVWTNAKSWKVKRIRRNPAVTLQVCDSRGRAGGGAAVPGTAQVLDAEGTDQVRKLVGRKYGVLGRLAVQGHKLVLGKDRSIGLSVAQQALDE